MGETEAGAPGRLTTEPGVYWIWSPIAWDDGIREFWTPGEHGAPLIDGCLARFDCAMHQRVEAGDHDILMGRVTAFSRHEGKALVYHGGVFAALG